MNDHPNALELIQAANDELARTLLPLARPDQLYTLRMITNALGIAARELSAHERDASDETRGLALLYAGNKTEKGFDSLDARNRQLARDIRTGAFESDITRHAQLRQHLVSTARRKLAAAYPKGLTANS
jgi:hypothetical protein